MTNTINLFFPYYQCGDEDRQKEIDLCLRKNLENQFINKVFVLIDDGSTVPLSSDKIKSIHLENRPTYKDWIELSKGLTGFSILCNSDIYFDESIVIAREALENNKSFLSLSRWELVNGKTSLHTNPHWSQDVWGVNCNNEFDQELVASLDFPMGVPRCDNKIAYLFAIRGWDIKNPCRYLKSIHVHETDLRTYHKKLDTRILGGVAYVHPGETHVCNAKLEIDIWAIKTDDFKSVAINKSMQRWIKEAIVTEDVKYNNIEYATAEEIINALKYGEVVYKKSSVFEVVKFDSHFYFKNIYTFPIVTKFKCNKIDDVVLPALIPAVLSTYIDDISKTSSYHNDVDFWQYPAATEKQAYENHRNLKIGENFNSVEKIINIYVPIPWATYIDKKNFSSSYLAKISKVLRNYKSLASEFGVALRVHTVCQHIHWVRILETARKIGITDLHLSHKYSKSDSAQKKLGYNFLLHGWPLIAVNYAIASRSKGIERKPINERRLLASFIGAHMQHYRDDSRKQIFLAAKEYACNDVFVDLGEEWHFNKVVYEEQVLQKKINSHHVGIHDEKTYKYNTILSDSKFTLCPEGAGPNTLRFWESIAVGSIPVIFSSDLSVLQESELGKKILNKSILWDKPISESLFLYLRSISEEDLDIRHKSLIELYEIASTNNVFKV